jgi:acyl-CoA synthetase (NDP forming)
MWRCSSPPSNVSRRSAPGIAGPRQVQSCVDRTPSPSRVRALLDAAGERLTEREGKAILAAYGVPVALDHVVATCEAAVEAAEAVGYPVVLKVESPDIAHKTEAGVVRLDLRSADAVRAAYVEILAAAQRHRASPGRSQACWSSR